MEDKQKLMTLVSWGMNPKGIKKTWAWNNFEEANKINKLFDKFINKVRSIV